MQEGALEPTRSPGPTPPAPNGAQPGPALNPLTGRPFATPPTPANANRNPA
jgi:hypothetical protein